MAGTTADAVELSPGGRSALSVFAERRATCSDMSENGSLPCGLASKNFLISECEGRKVARILLLSVSKSATRRAGGADANIRANMFRGARKRMFELQLRATEPKRTRMNAECHSRIPLGSPRPAA